MNDYLDYLQHHGIKGQKWGVRRFQNEDGTYTDLGNKRRNQDGVKEQYKSSSKGSSGAHKLAAKIYSINEKYYSKHGNKTMASMNKAAKEEHLKKAQEITKAKQDNVKAYSKQYDKASKMSDEAIKKWKDASDAKKAIKGTMKDKLAAKVYEKNEKYYEKHGNKAMAAANRKAKEERMKKIMQSKEARKKYDDLWEKASAFEDSTNAEWKKAKEMYKNTGSNSLSRIINNSKYDR